MESRHEVGARKFVRRDLFEVLRERGEFARDHLFGDYYWRWEEQIATPILQSMGYTVVRWWSSDRDGFGPLERAVSVTKDGVVYEFTYG
jgi:hypothetical protein